MEKSVHNKKDETFHVHEGKLLVKYGFSDDLIEAKEIINKDLFIHRAQEPYPFKDGQFDFLKASRSTNLY